MKLDKTWAICKLVSPMPSQGRLMGVTLTKRVNFEPQYWSYTEVEYMSRLVPHVSVLAWTIRRLTWLSLLSLHCTKSEKLVIATVSFLVLNGSQWTLEICKFWYIICDVRIISSDLSWTHGSFVRSYSVPNTFQMILNDSY